MLCSAANWPKFFCVANGEAEGELVRALCAVVPSPIPCAGRRRRRRGTAWTRRRGQWWPLAARVRDGNDDCVGWDFPDESEASRGGKGEGGLSSGWLGDALSTREQVREGV